ncbi:hypothetical protein [Denitratimonas sp. CY0512]|uniref:hypothetical protein n=1 Tax=Denitratimonas sp. CY0512 TaxID=3131940 RepID=UPI0030A4A3E9
MATETKPKLDARMRKALLILEEGGKWHHSLKSNRYIGREQFAAWLEDDDHVICNGFGMATFLHMKKFNLIVRDFTVLPGSAWQQEWTISHVGRELCRELDDEQ